jgi:hypothetical protein
MCHKHAVPLLSVSPQRLKLNFELVEYNLQMQHQALGVICIQAKLLTENMELGMIEKCHLYNLVDSVITKI